MKRDCYAWSETLGCRIEGIGEKCKCEELTVKGTLMTKLQAKLNELKSSRQWWIVEFVGCNGISR